MRSAFLTVIAIISAGTLLAQQPKPPDPPNPPRPAPRSIYVRGGSGPYLGIGVADVNTERAKELKLPEERGVEVKSVTPDGPAAKAGIQEGDVVLEYNGQRVEGRESLLRMVRETPAGRQVRLEVWRNGASQTLTATLGKRPRGVIYGQDGREWTIDIPEMPNIVIPRIPDAPRPTLSWRSSMLGVESESLNSQLAEYFGVKEGVLVRSVVRDSPAEKAGIKAGDVIVKLDGTAVTSPREISSVLRSLRGAKRTVPVIIVRERKERTLMVTLEEPAPRAPARIRTVGFEVAAC